MPCKKCNKISCTNHDSLDGALDVVDAGAERPSPAPAPPPAARTRGTAASPPPPGSPPSQSSPPPANQQHPPNQHHQKRHQTQPNQGKSKNTEPSLTVVGWLLVAAGASLLADSAMALLSAESGAESRKRLDFSLGFSGFSLLLVGILRIRDEEKSGWGIGVVL